LAQAGLEVDTRMKAAMTSTALKANFGCEFRERM